MKEPDGVESVKIILMAAVRVVKIRWSPRKGLGTGRGMTAMQRRRATEAAMKSPGGLTRQLSPVLRRRTVCKGDYRHIIRVKSG